MDKTLVMKFGGTSVGSAAALIQAAQLIQTAREQWPRMVVVISAMSGVTNGLVEGAHASAAGDGECHKGLAAELDALHRKAIEALLKTKVEKTLTIERLETHLNEFSTLCHAVYVLGEASPRALDAISSLGERINIHILAARLRENGCPAEAIHASELIRTDAIFQAANPDMETTRELSHTRLTPLLEDQTVPIVTGFMGATAEGALTTLGRGGSDYSAAILAAALDASELWIWTDVNGVMTTDPRLDPLARTLRTVTYREIAELAYYGGQVLHPKTIRPVLEKKIALWIRNTFDPEGAATQVLTDNKTRKGNGAIRAVTAIRNQSLITIEGRGMIGVQGIAARSFSAVARTNTSVTLISQASSEQSICFMVPASASDTVIASIEIEFQNELVRSDIDRVWALENVVIVTVVGAGMRHTPGIAGRIFSILGAQGLNVIAIAQGSSECSISLVTSAADADESVRAIHSLIVGDAA
jgi:aspartate kinase